MYYFTVLEFTLLTYDCHPCATMSLGHALDMPFSLELFLNDKQHLRDPHVEQPSELFPSELAVQYSEAW